MHKSSYIKMNNFVDKYLSDKINEELVIFDLGSQDVNGIYKDIFKNSLWKYIGCDISAGKNVDIVLSDPYDWKEVESNSMDVVISGQAFEHIEYFWNTMMELVRVLKVDGMGCIIVPGIWPEHRYPLDCWRFYPDGLSTIAKFAGVKVIEVYTTWIDPYQKAANEVDSVLIFKKVKLSESEKLKQDTKIELVKSLVKDYEINI